MECYAVQEEGPDFACLLVMHLSPELFPGVCVGLLLHYFLPEFMSFIHEEIHIQLEDLYPSMLALHCTSSLAFLVLSRVVLAVTPTS